MDRSVIISKLKDCVEKICTTNIFSKIFDNKSTRIPNRMEIFQYLLPRNFKAKTVGDMVSGYSFIRQLVCDTIWNQ